MQIIAELEREPRGVYCGAIGSSPPAAKPSSAWRSVPGAGKEERRVGLGVGSGITWTRRRMPNSRVPAQVRFLSRAPDDFRLIETPGWKMAGTPCSTAICGVLPSRPPISASLVPSNRSVRS